MEKAELEERVRELERALEPFAKIAETYIEGDYGFRLESTRQHSIAFTRLDVERARQALSSSRAQPLVVGVDPSKEWVEERAQEICRLDSGVSTEAARAYARAELTRTYR